MLRRLEREKQRDLEEKKRKFLKKEEEEERRQKRRKRVDSKSEQRS